MLHAKIDNAVSFYRIGLQSCNIPRLLGVIVLPSDRSAEPLVALPLVLPMGCWVESPPYFTAVTETACNLLNTTLQRPHITWSPMPAQH